ncbi:flagellar protein FliS [Thermanaeromonas toyohensis ToBE]|uniref:Flagellar secretion chaperone FliS n=1 Tax=Thermanaeromonas toyohensis ToBE TaxID=698762 RepID=A0A1W1VKL6_9FIRM|nr:flagellar export chaperone FliS [Thermanaeromonas toyohensis]SMB93919.1 flagellar protein FliS [Thermanaeromonas toyohensis ToBE]
MEIANKYLEMAVTTASPERLILLLYDGAINFLTRAMEAISARDFTEANRLIIRVEEIITELKNSLDTSYEIGKSLEKFYDLLLARLFAANVAKDREVLLEVQRYLKEMRSTWEEAIKQAAPCLTSFSSKGLEV